MECQLSSFPVILSFLLFVFMIWKKSKSSQSTLNLPPGPWKLPLVGNMHQLVGSHPHRGLRELAMKHGPLMHLKLGEASHFVISSAEAAKEVLKTHDLTFAQRPRLLAARAICYNYTDVAFAPYGDYWRQVRKICTLELLSAKRVQSYRSIREEEVSNLITSISSNARLSINFSKMIFSLINDITARAAFGGRCEDNEKFKQIFQKMLNQGAGFSLADMFPSVKFLEVLSGVRFEQEKLVKEAETILEKVINEHRSTIRKRTGKGEPEDIVDVLLHVQKHGDLEFPLTKDNIKAVVLDMFVAGTESSSTTIEWAMSEMLKNPRVMEKAQTEVRKVFDKKGNVDEIGLDQLQYLKLVVKETMRLRPPAPLLLPRECRESCQIFGYDIPKGSKVIVNAWAIARDPSYWNDAESFYPERFLDSSIDYKGTNFQFIPFGAGRRICPGITFGLANVELPLAQLLYHFNWKLPNGITNNDLDMTENFGVSVTRKNNLYLIPIPYSNSKLV
ncbi:putative Cytochrome P450 [Melia azedarach]|uniref:Cytochrome P450 n=2 Tax=Melia azedarach TaxID=155640 RepID=A0ACC1XFW1_MELAZ|nr:putative Cytochrome P450 [Melia azedarach]KAJ4710274.1 putative Cytochrome P450 [Melia azedarach]